MPSPYMTIADIAIIYRIKPRTARKWAAADKWRHKGTRPRRYSVTDAQRSYDKHHGGRVARHLVRRYAQPRRVTVPDSEELVRRIRELHRPRWYDPYARSGQVWLVCRGCDEGAHAEVPASWPCSTAEIVYTAEEIAQREPRVPDCPENHRTYGEGPPVSAQAVFVRTRDGRLMARRWDCDHVPPVPVESGDPS